MLSFTSHVVLHRFEIQLVIVEEICTSVLYIIVPVLIDREVVGGLLLETYVCISQAFVYYVT